MLKISAAFCINSIVCILLCTTPTLCFAKNPNPAPILGIVPDAGVQARLDQLISLAYGNQSQRAKVNAQDGTTRRLALVELLEFMHSDEPQKIRQLIYWSHQAEGVGESLLSFGLVKQIDPNRRHIAQAIAPMFDHVFAAEINFDQRQYDRLNSIPRNRLPLANLLMLANDALQPVEMYDQEVLSIELYRELIPKSLDDANGTGMGLVSFLFKFVPGQTLLEVANQQLGHDQAVVEFLKAERAISDYLFWREWKRKFPKRAVATDEVRTSLSEFAVDDRWWVRLYAVQIYNRAPELADGSTLELLSKDPHPRVQSALDAETLQNQ